MLVFVTALKSARASRDWGRVCRLFERTARSACAQTAGEFRHIVVVHDRPAIQFEHPNLEFMQANYPAPAGETVRKQLDDRKRKVFLGLLHARRYSPTHVTFLDADDLVNRRLAAHAAIAPEANGWYFRRGYVYGEGMDTVYLMRRRFHQWSGTSHLLAFRLLRFPRGDDLDAFSRENRFLNHVLCERLCRERGTALQPLPFAGAVYCVAHGDNSYDHTPFLWPPNPAKRLVKRLLHYRPLTPAIRAEFGLSPAPAAAVY